VLIYAALPHSPFQAAAKNKLDDLAAAGAELWVSRQILREYIAAMTRPGVAKPAPPRAAVLADAAGLVGRFQIAEDGPGVFTELLTLLAAVPCGGRQVYDTNIVATMLAHGVPNLLTHNTADFTRFGSYIAIIPLVP
jgi:predicted nucleic acid-binding protein